MKIVFITIILFLGHPFYCFSTNKAIHEQTNISLFSNSIQSFHGDVGRFPSTQEGLLALRRKPENASNWKGPYLNKEISVDVWRNTYVYNFPAKYGKMPFDLYSIGANSIDDSGDKDDITNWRDLNPEFYNNRRGNDYITWLITGLCIGIATIILARNKLTRRL